MLAVVGMFLVPLPTALLDILLVLNISLSLLLLLVVLYTQNVASLLVFPSLLLLATLFRLGLNVASTRLILTNGFAGDVIQSFGTLLIRGDVLVGAVIFTIVTIVNFIVITRGATRVSEVGARFALDAMPGKQLAIDSDLKSGVISPEEARDRRDELRRESQLYGAMDGAMRFIQGDAIASICIIVVNVLGGLYQGLVSGLGLGEAVQTYTLLTVGDGLVTQIPALLTSICAGVVVTRVSSSEDATLSGDLSAQLFGRPRVLIAAAALVLLIGFLPGLPFVPFAAIAATLGVLSYTRSRNIGAQVAELTAGGSSASSSGGFEANIDRDNSVVILLDPVGLMRQFRNSEQAVKNFWDSCSRNVQDEVGALLPGLRIRSQAGLGVGQYLVSYNGSQIVEGSVPLDAVFSELSVNGASSLGIPVLSVQRDPHFNNRGGWVPSYIAPVLQEAEFQFFTPVEFIVYSAASYFARNPGEILSLTDVHGFVKQLEKRSPGVVGELLQNGVVNLATITQLMHALVVQGAPVRDFRQIIEGVASYCSMKGAEIVDSFDFQEMLYSVRKIRRRTIFSRLKASYGGIYGISLSEPVVDIFERAILPARESEQLPAPIFDDGYGSLLKDGLLEVIERVARRGALSPFVVIVPSELRDKVARFLSAYFPYVNAVTVDELGVEVRIDTIGTWELARGGLLLGTAAG